MGIGKYVVGILDVSDRIVQIYYKQDLQEVQLLKGLENEYFECEINGINYELNLFKYKDEFKLTMYEMEDGVVVDYNEFDNIELKLED